MDFVTLQHPIAWFRERYLEGTLVLKPPFQRKPVWGAKQKCYLIESILLKLPVPEVYIQVEIDPEGNQKYAVVDGQQRIRTIFQFIGIEKDPEEAEHNRFVLDQLAPGATHLGTSFAQMDGDDRQTFFSYMFAVRALQTSSDELVRDVFKRLNKFLTPLNEQELRNATYTGPFVKTVEALAEDDYWFEHKVVSKAQIRRMKDIEFVSELMIGSLHGPQAGSPSAITEYYVQYEDYEEFPEQKKAVKLFKETMALIQKLLPEIEETRWVNISDFYTFFVACAVQLRTKRLPTNAYAKVVKALEKFEKQIDRYRQDDSATVPESVKAYVAAVERGANDKKRRADRHGAILEAIEGFFLER